ncbi:CHAT domain-containing protein [Nonomuraea roseoviolacea]|uniref:Tetratricopeptide (TPR) repeat protein n=1 Tax=Nonomuraea roseoviolacea subsp. carminata TaxID=160689 RepID=A0ABT1JUW5_9ACTN|nr:CHAT domain-containing protein [Nonomuraea roseoviolacea]MCP2345540.1 tetratricopeptide (TPR) repeat protein [Nonomuraea roseoviolacea subsp. carminata]
MTPTPTGRAETPAPSGGAEAPAATGRAETLLRLAEADPGRLRPVAARVVRAARAEGDAALESAAERALGVAAVHLLDLTTAARHFRAAIRFGERAGLPEQAAEARIRLAFVTSLRGRPQVALDELDALLPVLHGVLRARAEAQRAAVFNHLGRAEDAMAGYRAAVPVLRRTGDHLWLQRVLSNRAVMHGYRQELTAAESDLREAEGLCTALDLDLSLAVVRLNLGWVSALRGDVPAALACFDRAEERFRALGTHQLGWLLADRGELLLSVGLVSEARLAAREAVDRLQRTRRAIGLPEVRLLLARTAGLEGDDGEAVREARRAVTEFTRQGRPEWAALARFAVLRSLAGDPAAGGQARADGGERAPASGRLERAPASGRLERAPASGRLERAPAPGRLERAAVELDAAGWPGAAVEARVLAARLALERGRVAQARRQLEQAARPRFGGPALTRARAWHATALLRLTRGNERGAATAARAGLRVLDEHRATLGATDLRAYSGQYRLDLAALGLGVALRGGRAEAVLAWAEEGRASHLLMPPVHPPDDPGLARALTDLRSVMGEINELRRAGRPTGRLDQRRLALEREIRDHHRRLPAGGPASPGARQAGASMLAGALGDAALVEFVLLEGELHAVTVAGGRLSLHHLGSVAPVRDLADRVPFALRRLARRTSAANRDAAAELLRHAADRLDAALLRPLAAAVGDRPLVVIPTGPLQALPWSILPSCAGRPTTVSPSATLWYAAACAPPPRDGEAGGHVLVVAGPGLPGALGEAEAVARLHGVDALTGADAGAEHVLAGLDGARLAHLAAHGRLHAAHPLFSSLHLSDGPLTLYDLERLRRAPRVVVLAACESGRSIVRAGDELLGLSATFLAHGARTVIASVVPVPDAETASPMVALHRLLAAGHSAATALAEAQREVSGDLPGASAGFVCVGADVRLDPPGT